MNIAYEDLRILTKVLHEALQEIVTVSTRLMALDNEIRDLRRQLQVLRSQQVNGTDALVALPKPEDS